MGVGNGRLALGIIAPAASGKSTLARHASISLQLEYVSFGDFVRHVGKETGAGELPPQLLRLGEELIATLGHEELLRRTVAFHRAERAERVVFG